ncbi:MAG: hypothetical protein ACFE75_09700 [Candidatus Hodarchaeota archaeon]
MNYKKIFILISLLFLLFPINNAIAFTYIDNIKNGNYVFFLIDLEAGNNLELSITHDGSGNFTLFLFNSRPIESYVKDDKTLNHLIFGNIALVEYSLEDNPYINYSAPEAKIYYIEIILDSNGPDTFTLNANKDLTRYYLPIIPGFQLEILIAIIVFSIGLILIFYKKKMNHS